MQIDTFYLDCGPFLRVFFIHDYSQKETLIHYVFFCYFLERDEELGKDTGHTQNRWLR